MEELKWFEPGSKEGKNDVSIRIGLTSEQRETVNITFRNGLYQMISESDRIKIAMSGNRMYFAQSREGYGYKLNKVKSIKADNRYVQMGGTEVLNRCRLFRGDYDLKFDKERNLYYIERKDN